ncbi:MAG: NUDIX hydrolase [bacterium]|nr:NUDIX hydrolase [bacterium]
MSANIKRLEELLVYSDQENPWLKLYFDRVEFSDGRVGRYNRIVEAQGKQGVAVLPLAGAHIGLARQFRYPVGKELWEIPRGFAESGRPEEDALRELREETGLNARELVDLGTIHPNSGVLASEVQIFAAICDDWAQDRSITDGEVAEFRWLPVERVLSLIKAGDITDAFTLCAVLRAKERGIV